MNLSSALRYLESHINVEATAGRVEGLSLDRITQLLEYLGHPETSFPSIHVTGTNGKGSVARMISALLRGHGLSVGTYSSPHLEHLNERIAWDGQPIEDDELANEIADIARIEEHYGLSASYFEILTAAAFSHFANKAVEVAVVEVGMLGRFDATNVLNSSVVVCTNIERDHTDGGPGWKRAIADEKAGLIKPGLTDVAVLGRIDDDLVPIFEDEGDASVWRLDYEFGLVDNRVAVGGRLLDVRTPSGTLEDVYIPVYGAHQGENVAVAIAAVEAFLGHGLDEELVNETLAELTLPGRFEVISRHPTVVIDGAHNPAGAAVTAETLGTDMTLNGSLFLVVGLLDGRDPSAVLQALGASDAGMVITCSPDSPRAIPAPELASVAEALGAVAESVPEPVEAFRRAQAYATEDDLILVTGSHYVSGPVRTALHNLDGFR